MQTYEAYFVFPCRTLIKHTKALDATRPVTYVTDSNYARDKGVSFSVLSAKEPNGHNTLIVRIVI